MREDPGTVRPTGSAALRGWFRRNGILISTISVWGALVVASAVGIDLLLYQPEKKRLVTALTPEELFPADLPPLMAGGDDWQRALQRGDAGDEVIPALARAADAAVTDSPQIRRITILAPDGRVLHDTGVAETRRAPRSHGTVLWLRESEIRYVRRIHAPGRGPAGDGEGYASIQIRFTTPGVDRERINAAIAALRAEGRDRTAEALDERREALESLSRNIAEATARYRALCLGVAALLTLVMLLLLRWIVLPVRRVTAALDTLTTDRVRVLSSPRSLSERLYNEMARGASLARLQEILSTRILAPGERVRSSDLFDEACRFLTAQDGIAGASWRRAGADDEKSADELIVEDATEPDDPALLRIEFPGDGTEGDREAESRFGRRTARVISLACGALLAGSRTILRERQQANVNLARNLGHDLTNVIATAKLDLMTLGTVARLDPSAMDAPKMTSMREALEGVTDTIRCLQEIVNLYRAYAFLREPTFEPVAPESVVGRTVELFRLIHSRNVGIRTEFAEGIPVCRLDSRLLQLALFNLLANAARAIRDSPPQENPPEPLIRIRIGPDGGGVRIEVEDNGPGIRGPDGSLMDGAGIQRIFEPGYTLRDAPRAEAAETEAGEGLGLAWVRTIIEEIHGGRVSAVNQPGSGACFTITLGPGPADD